jgi:hypothetical protein
VPQIESKLSSISTTGCLVDRLTRFNHVKYYSHESDSNDLSHYGRTNESRNFPHPRNDHYHSFGSQDILERAGIFELLDFERSVVLHIHHFLGRSLGGDYHHSRIRTATAGRPAAFDYSHANTATDRHLGRTGRIAILLE